MMTVYVSAQVVLDQVRLGMKCAIKPRTEVRMNCLRRLEGMLSLIDMDEKVAVDEELYEFLGFQPQSVV
jgi:hypothetical protein